MFARSILRRLRGGGQRPFSTHPEKNFKAIIMLKRKEGMGREEFENWWLGQHKPLAMRLPGLKKYTVNLTEPVDGQEPMYDGVAELWFDKKEDLLAAYQTDIGSQVAADSLAVVCKRDRLLTYERVFEP
ncbi:hypothetical protein AAMO2058_000787000 [Amorphochlora amoebiformis]